MYLTKVEREKLLILVKENMWYKRDGEDFRRCKDCGAQENCWLVDDKHSNICFWKPIYNKLGGDM